MIDGYSQPEESKFLIQKGIHTLLGINTISNLSKSLVTIERRKANKLSNETEEISTKEEEKQLLVEKYRALVVEAGGEKKRRGVNIIID